MGGMASSCHICGPGGQCNGHVQATGYSSFANRGRLRRTDISADLTSLTATEVEQAGKTLDRAHLTLRSHFAGGIALPFSARWQITNIRRRGILVPHRGLAQLSLWLNSLHHEIVGN